MLEFGNKNRTQHPTDANAESSRSHAVFQVCTPSRRAHTLSSRFVRRVVALTRRVFRFEHRVVAILYRLSDFSFGNT